MLILGVTHPHCLNNAAAILRDGELVAMAEEERFVRLKHAPRMAPLGAIKYCLEAAGATIDDVDRIAVGWSFHERAEWYERFLPRARREREAMRRQFRPLHAIFKNHRKKVEFVDHHTAHAASTYLFSGFERVNVMTIDGSGGESSGVLGVADGTEFRELHRIPNDASWGNMYTMITKKLGFRPHSDEGKVMGLAAFGTPDLGRFDFIDWDDEIPRLVVDKFKRYRRKLKDWENGDKPDQDQKDLAATAQHALEQVGLRISEWLTKQTGSKNLALAGGCALNCSMNGFLLRRPHVEQIFVQPVAHDAGTALGAAAWVYARETGRRPKTVYDHLYFGPEFSNAQIEAAIREYKLTTFKRSENIAEDVAELLAQGRLVGWFQGRMEAGPRALGGRSMLANPGSIEMKDKMNAQVKHREGWRPFAPSFLADKAREYVTQDYPSPFMILAFEGREGKIDEIPAAAHVDGTVRVQTVNPATNLVYHEMISAFHRKTGLPAVLNTSFNVAGQPIVCTPFDAIGTFFACGLDRLAIGDYLIRK